MKTEILTKQDFQPIELKITIETKRELEFILSLTNGGDHSQMDIANKFRLEGAKMFLMNEELQLLSFSEWDNLKKIYYDRL
jgi:hypothetical protein